MKKSNLITVSAAVLLLSVQSVAAQVCTTPPTCDALGYTKTEADCSGKTILKCPLDQTKVYCPGYEETQRKYKVGDSYIDANGIGVGKIVRVDSSGLHGIVVIAGGTGDGATATTTCASRTAGGLSWSLASGDNACKIDGNASCCSCNLRSSSGTGYCALSDGWNSQDCSGELGFYCEAPF